MSDPQGHSTSGHSAPGQETPGPNADTDGAATAAAADAVTSADTSAAAGVGAATGTAAAAGVGAGSATSADPVFADHTYRSVPSAAAGVLLVVLTLWLCGDAMVRGHGQTPWYGLAALAMLLPLFVGFTLWPCLRAGRDRLQVRNPFRTINVPWSEVQSIQAALSVELRAGGRKYQVWAIPVSLRQRKRAGRRAMIAKGDEAVQQSRRSRTGADGGPGSRYPVGGPGLRGRTGRGGRAGVAHDGVGVSAEPSVAWADRTVNEIRELAAQAEERRPRVTGTVSESWTWWIILPSAAGAIAIALLAALG